MEKKKIFCIIPAYNESRYITEVINSLRGMVDEIVVVDDASSDNTVAKAIAAGAKVLQHVINRGQGAALLTGTKYALRQGADLIVHFDGDGQFLVADIPNMLAPLESGVADIVFGSRFLAKSLEMPWLKKRIIMPVARHINKLLWGINTTDPQSGFRAMTASAGKQILWEQDRMAHCSEILARAFAHKLRIKEVPITVIYHDFGQKLSGGFKIIKEMFLGYLIKI